MLVTSESAITSSSTRSPTSLLCLQAAKEDFKPALISDSRVGCPQSLRSRPTILPIFSFTVDSTSFLAPYF